MCVLYHLAYRMSLYYGTHIVSCGSTSAVFSNERIRHGLCYDVKLIDHQEGATRGTEYLICWKWVGIVNCTFCMLQPVVSYTQGREDKPVMSHFGAFTNFRNTTINLLTPELFFNFSRTCI